MSTYLYPQPGSDRRGQWHRHSPSWLGAQLPQGPHHRHPRQPPQGQPGRDAILLRVARMLRATGAAWCGAAQARGRAPRCAPASSRQPQREGVVAAHASARLDFRQCGRVGGAAGLGDYYPPAHAVSDDNEFRRIESACEAAQCCELDGQACTRTIRIIEQGAGRCIVDDPIISLRRAGTGSEGACG